MQVKDVLDSLDKWEVKSISDEDFQFAVEKSKLLLSLTNDQKLVVYG